MKYRITIAATVIVVALISFVVMMRDSFIRSETEQIRRELSIAVHAMPYIVPDHILRKMRDNTISTNQENIYITRTTEYARRTGIRFIYAFARKNKIVRFLVSSMDENEAIRNVEVRRLFKFEAATPFLHSLFKRSPASGVAMEQAKDDWGSFVAVYLPYVLDREVIIFGAEYEKILILQRANSRLLRLIVLLISGIIVLLSAVVLTWLIQQVRICGLRKILDLNIDRAGRNREK